MTATQPNLAATTHSGSTFKYYQQRLTIELTRPISTIDVAQQERAIATLVLAFSTDPAMRWLYPNSQQYLTHFPRFVQAFGGQAFHHHTAYITHNDAGAALWCAPGVEPDEEPLMALLQQSLAASIQDEVFAVLEQMSHYHPNEPHWYLPLIGVEPVHQGKGYGSALMQHVLNQCDRDRRPAYLEASRPGNIPFYERHGFKVLGMIRAGSSPPIFPMMRLPK